MSRAIYSLLLIGLSLPVCWADDDPPLRGKKLSEWIQQMQDANGDRQSRKAGLVAMGLYGPRPEVVDAVVKLFDKEKDEEIKKVAAQTMGKFGPKDEVVRHTLHPLCDAVRKDPSDTVREAAMNAIVRLTPTRDTPKSEYPTLHEMFRDTAVPTLIHALKDKHPGVRRSAAEGVGKVGPDARDAIEQLYVLLKDQDSLCRRFSAFAIGRLGADAGTAVPRLNDALAKETDPKARTYMIESLGMFGGDARESAELIGNLLCKDDDRDVRWTSAIALKQIGPGASAALPSLIESVDREKTKDVRCQSVKALGSVGRNDTEKILPALLKCMRTDPIAEVRLAAIEEVAVFGRGNKDVEDTLNQLTKDFRKEVSQAASDTLKKFGE